MLPNGDRLAVLINRARELKRAKTPNAAVIRTTRQAITIAMTEIMV